MRRAARCLVPFLLVLAGCSDAPKPSAAQPAESKPEPPQPVSAASAFYKVFFSARVWAPDAQPIRIAEIDVDELKSSNGKAAAWEAVFVSPGKREERRYIYSVIHRPVRNLRGGVTSDPPESWSPAGGAEPFLVQAFRTDSPGAYEVALKKGASFVKKNPGMPVRMLLEKTQRFPSPAWRVYWGESVSTSPYSVFIDATTGEVLGTGR